MNVERLTSGHLRVNGSYIDRYEDANGKHIRRYKVQEHNGIKIAYESHSFTIGSKAKGTYVPQDDSWIPQCIEGSTAKKCLEILVEDAHIETWVDILTKYKGNTVIKMSGARRQGKSGKLNNATKKRLQNTCTTDEIMLAQQSEDFAEALEALIKTKWELESVEATEELSEEELTEEE